MEYKHVHGGHRLRLKAKFERVGLNGFEDHEVLEYLLTFAIPQKNVNPLAHDLINHFGSLNNVFNASTKELLACEGVGPHTASLITLIPQLSNRYLDDPAASKRVSMAYVHDRIEFFIPKFVGETQECIYAAFLNHNWEVLDCKKMAEGSIDTARIEVRKLLDTAMRLRANGVVLAHNHLSHEQPSVDDLLTTKFVSDKLASCDITLIDHIVVCGKSAQSLAAKGQMRHVK